MTIIGLLPMLIFIVVLLIVLGNKADRIIVLLCRIRQEQGEARKREKL